MLIVTYNIQWGMGRDGQVDLARIARAVAEADIICLQEVERNWRPVDDADQVARFCELLPRHHSVFGASVDIADERTQSGNVLNRGRRQYGNLTLSRWPIVSTRSFPLSKRPVHGQINDASMLLECIIAKPGGSFRVYNTHFNYLSQRQRLMQAEEILRIIQAAPAEGGAVVGPGAADEEFGADWMVLEKHEVPPMPAAALLMGDFNMRTNSPEYDILAGPKDPFYGRLYEADLFADALTVAGIPENQGFTHADADSAGFKRIDHIFITADLIPAVRRAWIDEAADGSDHQPVWLELDRA